MTFVAAGIETVFFEDKKGHFCFSFFVLAALFAAIEKVTHKKCRKKSFLFYSKCLKITSLDTAIPAGMFGSFLQETKRFTFFLNWILQQCTVKPVTRTTHKMQCLTPGSKCQPPTSEWHLDPSWHWVLGILYVWKRKKHHQKPNVGVLRQRQWRMLCMYRPKRTSGSSQKTFRIHTLYFTTGGATKHRKRAGSICLS